MCTTSPRSSATARAPSTPISRRTASASSSQAGRSTRTITPPSTTYNKAILDGVVHIASKMGISSMQSYEGAQIFEAVGICKDVVDRYFTNTVSRVGGIGLQEIDEAVALAA